MFIDSVEPPPVVIQEPHSYLVAGQFDHMPPLPKKEENVQPSADLSLIQGMIGWGGECVRLARMYYPQLPRGNAIDIEPNSTKPEVGSFVLTNETDFGHIAILTNIQDDVLTLTESNVNGDEMITHDRTMSVDDPRIRGYYSVDKKLAYVSGK